MKLLIHLLCLFGTVVLSAQCGGLSSGENSGPITVTGNCSISGSVTLKEGSLTINSGASLTITGNFTNEKDQAVNVNGSMDVSGYFDNKDKGDLNVSSTGSLTISGNYDNRSEGETTVNGDMSVGGTFTNHGLGDVTVENNGTLSVTSDYHNKGDGASNFENSVTIGGNYLNEGAGDISVVGVVQVTGNFTVTSDGATDINGGLNIGGNASFGDDGATVGNGGVVAANSISSVGNITVENGGTIYAPSGISGTINVNGGNADTDCANNCCGALCDVAGASLTTEGSEILPITLTRFEAIQESYSIGLRWTTATELNFEKFELYKFNDSGKDLIGIIASTGNSNGDEYSFNDPNPHLGLNIYQLRSVDYDGYTEWFSPVSLVYQPENISFNIYPNPAIQQELKTDVLESFDLAVYSVSGQQKFNDCIKDGDFSQLPQLRSGIYIFRLDINGHIVSQRVVIEN